MPARRAGSIAIAILVVAACGSSIGPSPASSSASPAPTAIRTSIATISPSSTDDGSRADVFIPGDAIRVTAPNLMVFRDAPGTSDAVGEVRVNDVLLVNGLARVDSAGRLWLSVIVAGSPVPGRLPDLPKRLPVAEFALQGWIDANDATGAHVARIPPRCPVSADFANVAAMLGSEQVACFGSRSLMFDGTAGCAPCGADDGVYDPAWLAGNAGGSINSAVETEGALGLYLPSPLAPPAQGTPIRVRGHFADGRAAQCTITLDGVAWPQAVVIELCRQHFVVETIAVLPTVTANPLE